MSQDLDFTLPTELVGQVQDFSESLEKILFDEHMSIGIEDPITIWNRAISRDANTFDDYLNPRIRKGISERSGELEQELELQALTFFQSELSALRIAIDNSFATEDWLCAIDICDSLVIFFNLRTYWEELESTLQTALEAARLSKTLLAEGRILNNLGHTFRLLGRARQGIKYCGQSVEIFDQLDNLRGKAESMYTLGYLYRSVGQWPDSIQNFQDSLSLFEDLNDMVGKAGALDGLGQVYTKQGDFLKAKQSLENSLALKEELGDRFQISITCNNLGKVYVKQGNLNEAETLFFRSLAIAQERNNMQGQGVSFNELGEIYRLKGDFEKALRFYSSSLKVKDQISVSSNSGLSDKHGKGLTYMNMGCLYEDQEDIEQAIFYWEKALEHLNDYSPEFVKVQAWIRYCRSDIELSG